MYFGEAIEIWRNFRFQDVRVSGCWAVQGFGFGGGGTFKSGTIMTTAVLPSMCAFAVKEHVAGCSALLSSHSQHISIAIPTYHMPISSFTTTLSSELYQDYTQKPTSLSPRRQAQGSMNTGLGFRDEGLLGIY